MTREVWVKSGVSELGVGSLEARPRWESAPTEYGEIVRLDQRPSGEFYFTVTDAEEFDGSYASVQVSVPDLVKLKLFLESGPWHQRYVVSHQGRGWVVWDQARNQQHDPVSYQEKHYAEERAVLANRVDRGELDAVRDPHWVID